MKSYRLHVLSRSEMDAMPPWRLHGLKAMGRLIRDPEGNRLLILGAAPEEAEERGEWATAYVTGGEWSKGA